MNKLLSVILFSITFISLLSAQDSDSLIIKKVDSLIQISRAFTGSSEFEKALEINKFTEQTVLEKFGKNSKFYANVSSNFGRIYYYKGDYIRSEKYYIEARDLQKNIFGQNSVQFASTLQSLAILSEDKGDYLTAKELYIEAQLIIEKVKGKESAEYASVINSLGILYFKLGDYKNSEAEYIMAKDLREKLFGRKNLIFASSLNNMGSLYAEIGNYELAEVNYLEALTIREKLLGKEHPLYAKIINNLAILYEKLGDFEKSKNYAILGVEIRKKTIGINHQDYATSISTLCNILIKQGDYNQAELLMLEVKNIRENLFGKEHTDYAKILNNLALLYQKQMKYESAEKYFIESNHITEKIFGKDNSEYALVLGNLAGLYVELNSYVKAEQLYIEANEILQKIFNKMHPSYAINITNIAMLYIDIGDFKKTENYFCELNDLNYRFFSNACHYMSDKELNDYQYHIYENHIKIFSNLIEKNILQLGKIAYDNCLFYKGIVLNSNMQIRQISLANPNSLEKLDQLKYCYQMLSNEYLKSKAEQKNLVDMELKANTLEKELKQSIPGYLEIITPICWQQVQNMLNIDEATIEFVHYKYFSNKKSDSIMYSALVLLPNDTTPNIIPLFEEKELNQLLSTPQSRRMDYVADVYHSPNERGTIPNDVQSKSLYELIWKPLEPYLKGVNKIYFSPSGLLHRINHNAIALNDQTLLSDRYDLVQLSSTRQLATNEGNAKSKIINACIYGGINFEMDSTAVLATHQEIDTNGIVLRSELSFSYTDSTLRGGAWKYLSGSEQEANDINKIMYKAGIKSALFKGKDATEEAFKKLGDYKTESPQIIHISTHGYFFPDPKVSRQPSAVTLQEEPVFKISEHPMLRSGLIMAGANHAWKTGKPITPEAEDGILTAYEISQLNLRNTELVVLSACETGLGDIQGNEGVYGLQRAFKIAGVKNLIMSLWQVPDQQTSELMTSFYRYWLIKKKSIRESLKLAQNDLRKKGLESFYWAGFVLVE